MNIITSNKIYILILSVILLSFFLMSLFISFSNRVEGDAAFHALVSREIAEKGKIINSTSYILANEKDNFPIAYPEIFHLIGGITYLYLGNSTFLILPVLYGLFSIYFLILILSNLHKNRAAIILGIIILALNVYFLDYASKYFMEIALVFSMFAAIAYSIKYVEKRIPSNLYVASIFFGLSVAIKQQGIIALPILLIILLLSFRWSKSFKQIFVSLLLFIFVAAGPMIQLFYSTGSILYAGDNPPKIVQMFEQPLRNILHVQLLNGDNSWSSINQGRRDGELATWRDINNTVTAWTAQDVSASVPWVQLTGILLLILIIRVIKTKSMKDLIMLIFLTLFYILLYYLARPRYALPLIMLSSVTMFYIIYSLNLFKTRPRISLFVVAFFLIYTTINFVSSLSGVIFRDDYGFYGVYNTQRNIQLSSLYNAIKIDPDNNFTVLSPLPYETAFYTEHTSLWANPYGATDLFKSLLDSDENKSIPLMQRYHVKYLVVYTDRYMRFTNWAGINPSNGFLSNINNSNKFSLVKHNDSGSVYVMKE